MKNVVAGTAAGLTTAIMLALENVSASYGHGNVIEAISLLTEVLDTLTRDHSPLDWARAQLEMARALEALALIADSDGLGAVVGKGFVEGAVRRKAGHEKGRRIDGGGEISALFRSWCRRRRVFASARW